MQSAVLAYSGGVDSSFLLKAIKIANIRSLAVTAVSEIMPRHELLSAKKIAKEVGIEHRIINSKELLMEDFLSNTPERCFFCKDERFKKFTDIALSEQYRFILDGSNVDDTFDYRPGRKAATKYNVKSPLIKAGFSKKDIRELSRQLGLSTWDKLSSPCLATRIPYGRRITKESLKKIERAENFLISIGFHEVRVRDHGEVARIEVREDEIDWILSPDKKKVISETLKSFGYTFISLDLDGYKCGNMNKVLNGSYILWKALDT